MNMAVFVDQAECRVHGVDDVGEFGAFGGRGAFGDGLLGHVFDDHQHLPHAGKFDGRHRHIGHAFGMRFENAVHAPQPRRLAVFKRVLERAVDPAGDAVLRRAQLEMFGKFVADDAAAFGVRRRHKRRVGEQNRLRPVHHQQNRRQRTDDVLREAAQVVQLVIAFGDLFGQFARALDQPAFFPAFAQQRLGADQQFLRLAGLGDEFVGARFIDEFNVLAVHAARRDHQWQPGEIRNWL